MVHGRHTYIHIHHPAPFASSRAQPLRGSHGPAGSLTMKLFATSIYLAILLATAGEVSSGAVDPAFLPGLHSFLDFKQSLNMKNTDCRMNGGNIEKRQSGSTFSPPFYPAPKGSWLADWSASYTKAAAMVGQMTLAEKVNVTTAIGWSMVHPSECRSLVDAVSGENT